MDGFTSEQRVMITNLVHKRMDELLAIDSNNWLIDEYIQLENILEKLNVLLTPGIITIN